MYKKASSIFVVALLVFVVTSLMFNTVSAQEGTLDPNTPISNLDGVLAAPEVSANASFGEPFQGTGKLAPESSQLAGPNSSAAPVQGPTGESVIGTDGRIKVNGTTNYPNRAIAYLLVTWANSTQGSCTGWFVGPRTVVTAGHCVFNTTAGSAYGWAKSIKVYPGRNGATIPYGSTTGHRFFSATGWTSSTGDPRYDYGAIQTNSALGNTVGWFGWRWQSSNTFPGNYTVRGYPGDKPSATMWTMSGPITNVSTQRLWYSMDTYGGQSGSPLYALYNSTCCYGFGVHTYGTSVSPYFGNSATRITSTVSTNLTNWKNYVYP
jgi:glutamyl endopeptidase